jgi:hypothetical protein
VERLLLLDWAATGYSPETVAEPKTRLEDGRLPKTENTQSTLGKFGC